MPSTPPQAVAVRTFATQPTDSDRAVIARLNQTTDRRLEPVAFLVTVQLAVVPAATSSGWALYLDDFRVPKYWEYRLGIYFKVYDPEFFADHVGERLRFSANGTEFVDTDLTLTAPESVAPDERSVLPRQEEILNPPGSTER